MREAIQETTTGREAANVVAFPPTPATALGIAQTIEEMPVDELFPVFRLMFNALV